MVIQKSPLRYPGGKGRAVSQLWQALPDDTTDLLSPFIGGGSFELACASRGLRVRGSDVFVPLVNFWQRVLSDPDEVADEVERWFPFTRDDFRRLRRRYPGIRNDVAQAAAFWLLNACAYSGLTFSGGISMGSLERVESRVNELRTFNAPSLVVQVRDFQDAIESAAHRTDVVIYCDPPYMLGSGENVLYGDGGSTHRNFDHFRLHRVLTAAPNRWLLSYNDCEAVRHLYADYDIQTPTWSYGMSRAKGLESREVLICNL